MIINDDNNKHTTALHRLVYPGLEEVQALDEVIRVAAYYQYYYYCCYYCEYHH